MLLRVGLAAFYGLLLGLDRDLKNKPVDFRAYVIVAMSTCILAVLGNELSHYYISEATENGASVIPIDISKIIAGALTGIGFLGAGAILKDSNNGNVIGTATGASIWGSAIVGLCLGFGYIGLASIGFLAIYLTLIILGYCQEFLIGKPDKEKRD